MHEHVHFYVHIRSSKYLNNTIINTTLQALGCIWTNLRKQMNYTENKQVSWHTSSIDIAYNRM